MAAEQRNSLPLIQTGSPALSHESCGESCVNLLLSWRAYLRFSLKTADGTGDVLVGVAVSKLWGASDVEVEIDVGGPSGSLGNEGEGEDDDVGAEGVVDGVEAVEGLGLPGFVSEGSVSELGAPSMIVFVTVRPDEVSLL